MEENSIKIDNTEIDYVSFGKGKTPLILIPGLSLRDVKGSGLPLAYMYRIFAKEYSDLWFRVEANDVVVRDWFQIPLAVDKNGYVYGRLKPYRHSRTLVIKFRGTSKLMSFLLASSFEAMKDEFRISG